MSRWVSQTKQANTSIAPIRTVTAISITVAPRKPATEITGFASPRQSNQFCKIEFPMLPIDMA